MAEKVNSEILRHDWGFFGQSLMLLCCTLLCFLISIQIYHLIPVKSAAFSHLHTAII